MEQRVLALLLAGCNFDQAPKRGARSLECLLCQ
jgi:hypothetical protein